MMAAFALGGSLVNLRHHYLGYGPREFLRIIDVELGMGKSTYYSMIKLFKFLNAYPRFLQTTIGPTNLTRRITSLNRWFRSSVAMQVDPNNNTSPAYWKLR